MKFEKMEDEDYFFAALDAIEEALIAEDDERLLQLISEQNVNYEIHMDHTVQFRTYLEVLFEECQLLLTDVEIDACDPISSLPLEKGQICFVMDACDSAPVSEETMRSLIQYNTIRNPFTGLEISSLKRIRII